LFLTLLLIFLCCLSGWLALLIALLLTGLCII
jgi:hypothetical protein